MDICPTKILLIEDDEDDYILTQDLLWEIDRARYDLEWVDTYRAGLQAIDKQAHDIYLIDFRLGEYNGIELAREVTRRGSLAPVILLTGQSNRETDLEAMAAGAVDFLVKGQIDAAILERAIRYAIERKRDEEELRRARDELEVRVQERTAELVGANSALQAEIAERLRAEAEIQTLHEVLKQHIARLEIANNELEAFSYSVSHDLRAPLRTVDGFSQILLDEYAAQLDETGQNYLRRIRSGAQWMGELIDGLLSLSRLTRSELRREKLDLSAMGREIAVELREAYPQRQLDIKVADGLEAEGDARLVRVALENLIGNAVKFTAQKPQARIEMGRTNGSGEPAFYVRDNGVGFDMRYAGKLFGAFQRLHKATDFPGTGIGLATVARIIHRQGGRIWTEAEVGQGATFYFTL